MTVDTAPATTLHVTPPSSFDRIYSDDDDPNLLHRKLMASVYPEHERIRFAHVIQALQQAKLPLAHYVLYLATLALIYDPLESAFNHIAPSHSILSRFYFPIELNRLSAVRSDLAYFVGDDPSVINAWINLAQSSATQDWANRLYDLVHNRDNSTSLLLLSHAYTRYLGDLAGGQILRHRISKIYHLPPTGQGTAFYQFDGITDPKYFKSMYRQTLNQIGCDIGVDACDAICAEAVTSFQLNYNILEQLADKCKTLTNIPSPLIAKDVPTEIKMVGLVHEPVSNGSLAKCPLRLVGVTEPSVTASIMALGFGVLGFALGRSFK